MGNPVVRFEIGAAEDEPLVRFYGELFGWRTRAVADGYTLVEAGDGGIGGGIGRSRTGEPWTAFYVEVDDPRAVLDKAAALGGTTVLPVTELPGMAPIAMLGDPDGLPVGLVQGQDPGEAGAGGPPGGAGPQGASGGAGARGPSGGNGAPVDWFEVLGSDAGRSQGFYAELFGWTVPEGAYGQVAPGAAHGIWGGIGAGGSKRWATVYASVEDVEATLARAEALGATRDYGPNQVDDHMETGAFRDPAGNVFGVYHHAAH